MKKSKVSGSFVRLCGKNVGFPGVMKSPPIKLTVNSRFCFTVFVFLDAPRTFSVFQAPPLKKLVKLFK